jgi:hypothetical protein
LGGAGRLFGQLPGIVVGLRRYAPCVVDPVPAIGDVSDLCGDTGFQWEFRCKRCGDPYRSPFEQNVAGRGRGLLRVAGQWFGGDVARASWSMDSYTSRTGYSGDDGGVKSRHYVKAVRAMLPNFRQCPTCQQWRCAQSCWNAAANQCMECVPAAAPPPTNVTLRCASCGNVSGGKFCQHCGTALNVPVNCPRCGTLAATGAAFCNQCGNGLR